MPTSDRSDSITVYGFGYNGNVSQHDILKALRSFGEVDIIAEFNPIIRLSAGRFLMRMQDPAQAVRLIEHNAGSGIVVRHQTIYFELATPASLPHLRVILDMDPPFMPLGYSTRQLSARELEDTLFDSAEGTAATTGVTICSSSIEDYETYPAWRTPTSTRGPSGQIIWRSVPDPRTPVKINKLRDELATMTANSELHLEGKAIGEMTQFEYMCYRTVQVLRQDNTHRHISRLRIQAPGLVYYSRRLHRPNEVSMTYNLY